MKRAAGELVRYIARDELCEIKTSLFLYFNGDGLKDDLSLFKDGLHFLLFDNLELSVPLYFMEFLSHGNSKGLYVGYLGLMNQDVEDYACRSTLFVDRRATVDEVEEAFSRDPHIEGEGAICYHVKSGFVLEPSRDWCIWFSSYWEIAVACFLTRNSASNFRKMYNDINFLSNEEVITRYATNPSSKAPYLLSRCLEGNEIDNSGDTIPN